MNEINQEAAAETTRKTWDLSGSKISGKNFSHAFNKEIKKYKNVETLKLSGCKKINTIPPLLEESLIRLKVLDLSGSNISGKALKSIVVATQKDKMLGVFYDSELEVLTLDDCKNVGDVQEFTYITLEKLKTLSLARSNISSNGLVAILIAATCCSKRYSDLEVLILDNCKNIGNIKEFTQPFGMAADFHRVDLCQLKTLSLAESNITSEGLKTILGKAQNLEVLTLDKCQNIDDIKDFNYVNLSKLKTLSLAESNISSEGLRAFFYESNNLEVLTLDKCQNIGDLTTSNIPYLGSIKSLNLNRSNISLGGLKAILEKTPNLEELHLAQVKLPGVHFKRYQGSDIPCVKGEELKTLKQNLVEIEDVNYHTVTLGNDSPPSTIPERTTISKLLSRLFSPRIQGE